MGGQQKINSTQFASFSVFGLLLMFVLGGLIMIASYTLEPLIACILGRRNTRHYSQMEWCVNETLQLQRLAHELKRQGTWDETTGSIPATGSGEKLAPLDLNGVGPPVLLEEKQLARIGTFESEWSGAPSPSTENDKV